MGVSPQCFQDAWFLTGPTASGKTAVGVALAERIGAEIISMDSMALYQRLDRGTAKPSPEQRRRVPHHLVDSLPPWEECSLARYLEMAAGACEQIRACGRRILFVGGTPLYLKGCLRGIFKGPPADWERRRWWQAQAQQHGPQFVHEELRKVDPVTATRLHANDLRRVIRALEVYEKTGIPLSQHQRQNWQAATTPLPEAGRTVLCLLWPRDELYRRIDRRVEEMFATGLVEEVRELADMHPPLNRTARQALSYKEVLEHLEGRRGYAETKELVQRRTRRFAKHQLTWFRSLPECRFAHLQGDDPPSAIADSVLADFSNMSHQGQAANAHF